MFNLKKQKIFLPVIHAVNEVQIYKNILMAINANADGVFLISHGYINASDLIEITDNLKRKFPQLWIGINLLDIDIENKNVFEYLIQRNIKLDGIWIDDSYAGIEDKKTEALKISKDWKKYKEDVSKDIIYFGGVAFKYCPQPESIFDAVHFYSDDEMDIITTSGDATGEAAEVDKVKEIYTASFHNITSKYKQPIAIASGISIENIESYLPLVDIFLVSSSITKNNYFDEELIVNLSNMIHSYTPRFQVHLLSEWDELCPYCLIEKSSNNIEKYGYNKILESSKYHCYHCGNDFEVQNKDNFIVRKDDMKR